MGCSKNLTDSERLLKQLEAKGYATRHDPESPDAEFVVVNTCGFINDAKEESINTIIELSQMKQEGKIGKIIVMGCLSQRYLSELEEEIPEVDLWYGKFNWKEFIATLPDRSATHETPKNWERKLTTPTQCISEDFRRMQPLLRLLRNTTHNRPSHIPPHRGDSGRNPCPGGRGCERVQCHSAGSFLLWH